MSKAQKTLIEQLTSAGFLEHNKDGEVVKGTDFEHGWNSLDGRKRHLRLVHKNGRKIEMRMVPNGAGEPLKVISVTDGDKEIFKTTEGKISDADLKMILS